MTQTQKEQNKNLILNNLSNYIVDDRGDFVNLEKDFDDSDYIIWKSEVEDCEEVREKVIKEIIRDKSRWNKIPSKEIIEDIMESILLEKENWEIVTYVDALGDNKPAKYKYRPTGETISAQTYEIFDWHQAYILNGELGWREKIHKDYDQWGHYRTKEWWQIRNWKKNQRNKNKPPINPPPAPPEENKKYEESKKKAEEERQKQREPFQKKIDEIKSALSEELPLTDSDLSRQYQNWEEEINHSNDLQKVTKLQDKILADIQVHREEKKSISNSLKKFASIPNFNSKEAIEALIEPVKSNPNFLQQLKANNIPNLTALIVDKSPREIIITIKRFEYDKDKDKKIRAYYHLKSDEVLTDEQINNYLYREAIGQITSSTENLHPESNKLTIALIIGGVSLLILFIFIIIRIKWIKLKRK